MWSLQGISDLISTFILTDLMGSSSSLSKTCALQGLPSTVAGIFFLIFVRLQATSMNLQQLRSCWMECS